MGVYAIFSVDGQQVGGIALPAVAGARLPARIGRGLQHGAAAAAIVEASAEQLRQPVGPARSGIGDVQRLGDGIAEGGERAGTAAPVLDEAGHLAGSTNSSTMAAVQLKRPPPSGAPSVGS